jgi:hypothetical protein
MQNMRALTVVLSLTMASGYIFSQAMDGNLVVRVADQTDRVIVDAGLELLNSATGTALRGTTDDAGQNLFRNVLPGEYVLTVHKDGFSPATVKHISVELNNTATALVKLTLANVETNVNVIDAPVLIDTTSIQIQAVYQSAQVMNSPAAGLPLGALNLSLFSAGVASSGALGVGEGPSVGGQRPRANSFTIEGVDNNQKDLTLHNVDVPREAVAEISILQNQFSAEFGNGSGAQINTVIRGGGNQVHGALYDYLMNRHMNAVDESFARQGIRSNPRFDSNMLGASLGGPIVKDKLFYYSLFQYNPIGQAATPSSAVLSPTAAGYSQLSQMVGVSQTNLNILKTYLAPAPTASTTTDVAGREIPIGTLPIVQPSYSNLYSSLSSLDYTISGTDQLRGRYIYTNKGGYSSDTLPILPAFFQGENIRQHLVSLGEFHTFSSTLLNELRAGFSRNDDGIPAGNAIFPGLDAFPNLVIQNDLNVQIGPFSQAPQQRVQNTYQLIDNLSWTAGRHQFKFGWEGRKYISSTSFTSSVRGNYQYSDLDLFLRDVSPDVVAERTVGSSPFPGNQLATSWFANDQIRFRTNLTLTLGVRYEYQGILAGDKLQALNALASVPGLIDFRAPKAQTNDFAPRVGIAYSPGHSGKTTVRTGFGLAYDKYFDNLSLNTKPPELESTVTLDPKAAIPNFLANGGIRSTARSNTFATPQDARDATSGYITDRLIPYAINWNFGVQQVLFDDYALEVRYLGTRGVHLPTQTRMNIVSVVTPDRYLPTYLQQPDAATLANLRYSLDDLNGIPPIGQAWLPYFNQGPITAFPFRGNSTYNGLAVELSRRFARGLFFKGAYTWSHNIDDSTADVASTLLAPRRPENYDDMRSERASSFLDRRQRFTMAWTYETPWYSHSQNRFLRQVLGNYSLSGTYIYESPQLVTVQSGLDANLNFDSAGDRAIVNVNGVPNTGSGVYAIDRLGNRLDFGAPATVAYVAQNPNAQYILTGLGARSTSGRNTLPTRPIDDVDLAVKKAFSLSERWRLEVGAEAFNALNHPQYTPGFVNNVQFHPGLDTRNNLIPGNPMFNRSDLAYASNARSIQLFARMQF